MKRLLSLFALVLVSPLAGAAEPVPPAIEIRVKAVGELTGIVEYAGGVLQQPEAGKQFAGIIKLMGEGEKGIEGIDAAKPLGGYVRISENIADSAVVVMVPIKDEAAFLSLLKDKLNVEPKKGKEDVYSLELPQVPVGAIHFRFLHGYAYATIRTVKSIDPDSVIKPKEFFAAAPKSILGADIHWDRFPADTKKVMLGQIEMQLAEKFKDAGGSELQKQARKTLLDIGVDAIKTVLTDSKRVALTLDADPETDTISARVKLTAKPKTQLEKTIVSWADRESAAASASLAKNPLASFGVVAKLPKATHEKLGKIVDVIFDDALAGVPADAKPLVTKLVDAVSPTLKDGDVQLGLAVAKAGKTGLGLQAAVKATKGDELQKVLKEFAPFLMGAEANVKFDAEKVGDRNLHEASLTNADLKRNFGTEILWIATSDDLVALAIEEKPKLLKTYLEAKPKELPMLSLEIGVAQFMTASDKELPPEKLAGAVEKIFEKAGPAGLDTLKITVGGGQDLDVKLDLKGKALSILVAIDELKKK